MTRSPNRMIGSIVGAFFVLIGLLGFTVTGGVGFFDTEGGLLADLFQVNVFHNVIHILALNAADNVLHFATAVLLLVVGIGADSRATGVSA